MLISNTFLHWTPPSCSISLTTLCNVLQYFLTFYSLLWMFPLLSYSLSLMYQLSPAPPDAFRTYSVLLHLSHPSRRMVVAATSPALHGFALCFLVGISQQGHRDRRRVSEFTASPSHFSSALVASGRFPEQSWRIFCHYNSQPEPKGSSPTSALQAVRGETLLSALPNVIIKMHHQKLCLTC